MAKTTTLLAALIALSMFGCDDGPVKKRVSCIAICNRLDDCTDVDVDQCKSECREEDGDAIDACDDCIREEDSCTEKLSCVDECAGVISLSSL